MPRLLAIEWDLREARIAVARTRGSDVVLEHAFAVDLGPRDPGQTFADVNVGSKVAAALAARNVGRAETLVAVGRASIELRQLALPTCPLEELPDMVRFQAMREFTTLGEDWPLDFVHLGASEEDGFSVLAAAISPMMVDQIHDTCKGAELTPSRLILRPLAAASLLRRRDGDTATDCRLMVDLLSDEADLTVLVDEHVALMRTVRLSANSDSAAQSRALLGEIRRTIASAQNQLGGRRVEKVVLCGSGTDQAALKETIESELTLPVELFDPFSENHVDSSALAAPPEHAGRFTPLLGLLVDEAAEAPHAIDFLHPRKKPKPPNNARRNLLIAATAAAACLALVAGIFMQLASLDADVAMQRSQTAKLKKTVAAAETSSRHQETLQRFLDSDITWLDELSDLSEQLPPAEEVMVTQLNFATRTPAGAQIIVDGLAKESEQVTGVRDSLRAGGRRIVSMGEQDDPRGKEYRWLFKETVLIEPGESRQSKPAAAEDTPQDAPEEGAASEEAAPDKGTTNRADQNKETPNAGNPKGAAPNRATPNRAAPNTGTPSGSPPNRATPNRVAPNPGNPNRAAPNRTTPNPGNPNRAAPNRATPNSGNPNAAAPNTATPNTAAPNGEGNSNDAPQSPPTAGAAPKTAAASSTNEQES